MDVHACIATLFHLTSNRPADRDGTGRTGRTLISLIPSCQQTSLHIRTQALYRPNLEGEELVKLACQCLRAGLERDCASGYGLVAYLVTREGVRRTVVQGRMD